MTHQRPPKLVSLFAVLMLALGLLPAATSQAATYTAPAPQQLGLVSASRNALAVKWAAVPGATRYRISYSTSSTMSSAKLTTSTRPYAEIKSLSDDKNYYVTVRVMSADGTQALSPTSAVLKARTRTSSASYTYLAPTGLRSGTPTSYSLPLSWTSRGTDLRYQIAVAPQSSFAGADTHYVTGTSLTVKRLVDGVSYYVRIRVVSSKGSSRSGWSPTITVRTATVPVTATSAKVDVASYNVGSKSITTGGSWSDRRSAVVNTVLGESPDVIGFQEASQGKLSGLNLSQAEDLVKRLGSPYALANTARYNCKNASTPYKCVYKYQGASNSQKIAFDTTKLKMLKQGSKRTASTKTAMTQHRYVEWAIFRVKATGHKFFFVNVHLDPGTSSTVRSIRKKQMDQILEAIRVNNPWKLPTYVVGDLNSHKWTDPANVPYDRMIKAGYVDPLGNTWYSKTTAPGAIVGTRIKTQYSSHNNWERVARQKPNWINGIYIDYIWTSRGIAVPEWETVVRVDSSGRFIGRIPSDHNMLRATTIIR